MLAPPREHTGLFVPLSASNIAILVEDSELRSAYLNALTYMQDLVCPYWDRPEPARFDVRDAEINLGNIEQNYFPSDSSLDRHVRDNSETARTLAEEGRIKLAEGSPKDKESLRRDATSFMKGLLFTYNQIRSV
jgi:hypothetical protein